MVHYSIWLIIVLIIICRSGTKQCVTGLTRATHVMDASFFPEEHTHLSVYVEWAVATPMISQLDGKGLLQARFS